MSSIFLNNSIHLLKVFKNEEDFSNSDTLSYVFSSVIHSSSTPLNEMSCLLNFPSYKTL